MDTQPSWHSSRHLAQHRYQLEETCPPSHPRSAVSDGFCHILAHCHEVWCCTPAHFSTFCLSSLVIALCCPVRLGRCVMLSLSGQRVIWWWRWWMEREQRLYSVANTWEGNTDSWLEVEVTPGFKQTVKNTDVLLWKCCWQLRYSQHPQLGTLSLYLKTWRNTEREKKIMQMHFTDVFFVQQHKTTEQVKDVQ